MSEMEKDVVDVEPEATPEDVGLVLSDVKKRCNVVGMTYLDSSIPDMADVDIRINFPCGRETREIAFFDFSDLDSFKSIKFEDYNFIGNYGAIVSYSKGTIEALISAPNAMFGTRTRLRRLLLNNDVQGSVPGKYKTERKIKDTDENDPMIVSIKRTSAQALVICQVADPLNLSLVIKNIDVQTQEKALEILKEISNALFFSIDVQLGLYISLIRHGVRKKMERINKDSLDIQLSPRRYDKGPIDLYWYARSAVSMPLLQFLAYYQVVEFYYSTFFNRDIARRVRAILKNPNFRIESDTEITKIVSTIKSKGGGNGTEKDHLKATLKECVDDESLMECIRSNKDREAFFGAKNKGITSCTINLQNKNIELYLQVADRIYDIRCKIVHTKGDEAGGEVELLLPFSAEAEKLDHDIELMRFVAQQVMIYASR